ncbi:MAG: phosphoribosylformylglycinamidine synthase subunit PurS [Armatimonadota bacterium]|nr:phosphoribosylformylglycinamidine synthase subunit PurS [Armatimonadota bacterium]MDR5702153.1 phosphoribosylformylglycinamidine synthase subunit PurS [Armatimonadota bacterium]MDR7433959.1 phosphoribosylformylglycinamidine synthase subunit PurS [Armatimonadota bacterium]
MATFRVIITLKPGILDAQGQAIRRGLLALGFEGIQEVRTGRYLEIDVPEGWGEEKIRAMCEGLLAHPLVEEYRLEGC